MPGGLSAPCRGGFCTLLAKPYAKASGPNQGGFSISGLGEGRLFPYLQDWVCRFGSQTDQECHDQ